MTDSFTLKNGKTLLIKSPDANDYDAVQTYLEQLATETVFTNQYVGKPRPTPEAFAEKIKKNWGLVAWDQDKIAGFITAGSPSHHPWLNRVCSFGVHMLKPYYRQGLGHYFMNRLEQWATTNHMHKIEGEVRALNQAGIALYLKHGFIIEGAKRDTAFINGTWHTNYIIGKILDETNP